MCKVEIRCLYFYTNITELCLRSGWHHINIWSNDINSSSPSAAYMRQLSGSALVRVMACRLFDAKPLLEPVLVYCQLDSWEQISVKFELEFYHFHSRKCIWNCRLPKWQPFRPGRYEFRWLSTGMNYEFLVKFRAASCWLNSWMLYSSGCIYGCG